MAWASSRTLWSFVVGLLSGGALAWWMATAWHSLPFVRAPQEAPREHPAAQAVDARTTSAAAMGAHSVPDGGASIAGASAGCNFSPLLEPGNAQDGQFLLTPALSGRLGKLPGIRAYVAASREAELQGRPRDSEVALIVACRLAARSSPRFSVPIADMQAMLAQRYRELALSEASAPLRELMLDRAQGLLHASLAAYSAALGSGASKTRLAAQRVAALHRLRGMDEVTATAEAEPQPMRPEEVVANDGAAIASPHPGSWIAEANAENAPLAVPQRCAGEASPATRMPCADPELSQLHSDLQRLGTQAAQLTDDPEGFRRRTLEARARREAECRDKACLMRWYAERRHELLSEF